MVYGLDNCPEDAMGKMFNAVEHTKASLAKMAKNPEARYSPQSYGGLKIGRMYAENSSQGVWDCARNAIYQTVPGAQDLSLIHI